MNRIPVSLAGAVVALLVSLDAASAQTTFRACRVPAVGVIYMIGVSGAPSACLDASHVEFQWTEGGAPADNTITSAKITDGTIAAVDVADGAVTSAKIADGTIATADVANGAITQAKIDAGVSFPLAAGAVGTTELADNAVTSAKIAAGTVATADVADGAITQAKLDAGVSFPLAAGAVGTTELADGAVTDVKLAADAVTAAAIADQSVYPSDLSSADQIWNIWGSDGVVSFHPYFGDTFGTTLTRTDLSNTSYPQARFVGPSGNEWDYGLNGADNFTIELNDTAVCTLTTVWSCPATIPVNGVTATEITTDAVGADEIAAGAVETAEIADLAVTTAKLAAPPVANDGFGSSTGYIPSSAFVSAGSVSITVPGPGRVLVSASGTAGVYNRDSLLSLYIGLSVGGASIGQAVYVGFGDASAVTTTYLSAAVQGSHNVGSAGTYTYYLNANRYWGTGNVEVFDTLLRAVFIPN